MNQFFRSYLAIVFFLILALPLSLHLIQGSTDQSIENRTLQVWPTLPQAYTDMQIFIAAIERYLNDHFGLRKHYVLLAKAIQYHLFSEAASKQISLGSNGYIFLNSHDRNQSNSFIREICGVDVLPSSARRRIQQTIKEFVDYYRGLGYRAHFAIIPSKSRIYPDYLPQPQRDWCLRRNPTWLDQTLAKLVNRWVYYPLEKFRALKRRYPVYLSKHFHWHGRTPHDMAADIMQKLWEITPAFSVTPRPIAAQSDLSRHLGGLDLYNPSVSYDYSTHANKCAGRHCIEQLNQYYERGTSTVITRKQTHDDGELLLLTDSFGAAIAPHFIRGFTKVTLIDLNFLSESEQDEFFPWVVKTIQPTHILYLVHDGAVNWRTLRLSKLMLTLNP